MSDPRQQALSTFIRNLPSKWLEGAKHAVTQWPHDVLHFAETPARWALGDPEQNAIDARLGPRDLHPSTENLSPFSMGSPQRGAADVTSMANPLFAPLSTARTVAGTVGRPVGAAINEAMLNGTGPLNQLLMAARPMNVVKPRGGQWIESGVQQALNKLKTMHDPMGNIHSQNQIDFENTNPSAAALNAWVQGPLRKYVLRDMATPEDPVRALAEQGVLHVNPEALNFRPEQWGKSYHPDQTWAANSPEAKAWEGASDNNVAVRPASSYIGEDVSPNLTSDLANNPWIKDQSPNTNIHDLWEPRDLSSDLGFDHIIDYLKNQLDTGALRPEALSSGRVSMADAVRGTHAWNQELAANMAKQRVADMAGMPVHKDYGDGMKWVELTTPKDLPEGYSTAPRMHTILPFASGEGGTLSNADARKLNLVDPQILKDYDAFREASDAHPMSYATDFWPWLKSQPDRMDAVNSAAGKDLPTNQVNLLGPEGNHLGTFNNAEDAIADHGRTKLQDWLTQEGDSMGHCVGGYASDVASGRSRIFSLRDANGEPHVTVETAPRNFDNRGDMGKMAAAAFGGDAAAVTKELYNMPGGGYQPGEFDSVLQNLYGKTTADLPKTEPSIVQIKGKQNAAPIDKYLPYVQDFVKSGDWSSVGDLGNTGLRRSSDAFNNLELQNLKSLGRTVDAYHTPEEIAAHSEQLLFNVRNPETGEIVNRAQYRDQLRNEPDAPPEENFAQGGSVQIPTDSVHSVLSHFTNHYPEFVANA